MSHGGMGHPWREFHFSFGSFCTSYAAGTKTRQGLAGELQEVSTRVLCCHFVFQSILPESILMSNSKLKYSEIEKPTCPKGKSHIWVPPQSLLIQCSSSWRGNAHSHFTFEMASFLSFFFFFFAQLPSSEINPGVNAVWLCVGGALFFGGYPCSF